MQFPVPWIGQYVDLPGDEAVARAFTLSGSEVEGQETVEGETAMEFGITVNRPDCMNIYGLAREASVLFGAPLKNSETAAPEAGQAVGELTSVTVEDPVLCPRYRARVLTGVRVGTSPPWMQKRLLQCGLRPINAVADVTNFVLMELGHPLHAFDMDALKEKRIVVRRARPGEKITTLDGVERTLDAERLVIADAERPVALAGVMGGEDTGVTFGTTNVLLEGAVFEPVNVRRTSKALGMHTDASHRFERGVDPEGPVTALDRCAKLILEICGGRIAPGAVDIYPSPAPLRRVTLRHARIVGLLGMDIPPERCEAILGALGFVCEKRNDASGHEWNVTVPSFRVDVWREADLIEEVVRVNGLEGLKGVLPQGVDPVGGRPAELEFEERLRDQLVACGCSEAIHMSMTDPALDMALGSEVEPLPLANPLTPALSVLRTALLPPFLLTAARNRARGVRRLALFELGKAYLPQGGGKPAQVGARPIEDRRAAVLLYADAPAKLWGSPAATGFLALKGKVEAALDRLGLAPRFVPAEKEPFAKGLCLELSVSGRSVGWLGTLAPAALDAAGLKSGTAQYAEWSMAGLDELCASPVFEPVSRFPSVVRDFSFLAPKSVNWESLKDRLSALELSNLKAIHLADCYEGEGIPEGQKSWTVSLVFQSPERTLTEEDVAPVAQRVTGALREAFGAVLR
jgi:phenylalanyl-tRNA synthetase beta chain